MMESLILIQYLKEETESTLSELFLVFVFLRQVAFGGDGVLDREQSSVSD